MNIVAYISGHGFGHLAQVAPVLNRIDAIKPDCRFLIRCALPQTELRARLNFDFECEQSPTDVGVVQKNAVEEDRQASMLQMRRWIEGIDAQIDCEIDLLRRFAPSVVISDISPLAFPVAKALAVPGIGLATLDWYTIYSHWLDATDPVLTRLAAAYHVCDLLLTPPMAMAMSVFPRQSKIGLIAAQPNRLPDPLLNEQRRKALVLFGGCGNPPYDMQTLAAMGGWVFLIPGGGAAVPENVRSIDFNADVRPVDVMAFVDVVVCKPGYGVLSECWQTGTPIAWVERPDFPEFPMLKRWLDHCMPSAGMSRSDFQQGKWIHALQAAYDHPRQFPITGSGGACEAADMILSY